MNSNEPDADVPIGRYRHYKGRDYVVIGVARHSETNEELVVYRQDYGTKSLWVRPKAMFLETVEVGGRIVRRFEFVGHFSEA
jgi:hypothetical protein